MNEPDYAKIGKELRRLRTENHFTQEQFAEDLGCTISFISNVEKNRTKLNLRVLNYYSRICNASLDSIMNAGYDDETVDKSLAPTEDEIIRVLRQYTPVEQDRIVKMLKYMKTLE